MSEFTAGDLVEFVGTEAYFVLEGDARFGTLRHPPAGWGGPGYPWLLILTPEAQAALAEKDDTVTRDEADRLEGWLVREDEIRKVGD